jgi:hypothetical protein
VNQGLPRRKSTSHKGSRKSTGRSRRPRTRRTLSKAPRETAASTEEEPISGVLGGVTRTEGETLGGVTEEGSITDEETPS